MTRAGESRRVLGVGCALAFLLGLAGPAAAQQANDASARAELDAAWAQFMIELEQARASLVEPAYFPPEASERTLAEGHRYLLGHLGRLIDAELRLDPRFPEFHRSVDMLRKHTGENPDASYLKAPIDGLGSYRVTGRAADTREWRTSERAAISPKAPRLVTFQTITGVPGDTGTLEEMATCVTQTLDFVNSFSLQVDADGRFEILIAPERPAGHAGNFLASRKTLDCAATGQAAEREARYVAVREIFSDWERERPLELSIVRLGAEGESRPPIDAAWTSERLSRIGTTVKNHIRFWNLLMEFPLEMRRDANGDGRRNLPVNGTNDAAPPFTAGGAAGASQLYASGIFELGPDEALVVRVETPVEPHYIGFQLNNGWMEGPDQQNYVSSLTGHQNPRGPDGARRYVVAHRDPGIQGWVATTGLPRGFHSLRFVFREDPGPDELPRITTRRVPFDSLAAELPAGLRRVDSAERRREIAIRQAHIKSRWRAY